MKFAKWLLLLSLAGCVGLQRDCSSMWASDVTGADWIVVQYGYDGHPVACWQLRGVGITNEPHSDGIFWREGAGHLVHISGWYNRVQVASGDFDTAAKLLSVNRDHCTGGKYLDAVTSFKVPTP